MYDVLIVDDEYYICEGLVSSIRKLNLPQIGQIRTCFCGEEALSLCKTYKPQIVFTDIKMKEMNGIELIHALGRILHPVQFFILSGYDDFEYVRGAFQKGAADYLLKPILNEDLKTFFKDPWNYKRPEGGENIEDIVRRTGEFWKEKISDPDLQDKTVLITSHGCAVRALLQNVYRDKEDFWHGGPPPNCGVNVVEVADGRTNLLEKDRVYA